METLTNNFVTAMGWTILHSLWQGAIIYATLLLVLLCIPKAKAIIKHNLAFGSMCFTFITFIITFALIFNRLELKKEVYRNLSRIIRDMPEVNNSISSKVEHLFPLLVCIYIIGMIIQFSIITFNYNRTSKLKRIGLSPVSPEWMKTFQSIISQMHFKRKIAFHLSTEVAVPLVIGFFKPVILFPVALVSNLELNQVEAILIHELSHIRRNDYLLNLIKKGIEAVLFFNPFIWLTGKFVQTEREHACDDNVLKITGAPLTYAHALLKLELLKSAQIPTLSMAAAGSGQHLYERIKRITDMKTNYISAKQQLFAFILVLTIIISFAWLNPLKAERKDLNFLKAKLRLNGNKKITTIIANLKNSMSFYQDTTRKKKITKVKIVSAKGKRNKSNSTKKHQNGIITGVMIGDSVNTINLNTNKSLHIIDLSKGIEQAITTNLGSAKYINSPEWKSRLSEQRLIVDKLNGQVNSLELRKQLTAQLEDLKKQHKSQKLEFDQKALIAQSKVLQKQIESSQWKKQQLALVNLTAIVNKQVNSADRSTGTINLQIYGDNLIRMNNVSGLDKNEEVLKINLEHIDTQINSAEWKKQLKDIKTNSEEMQKYFNSPEFKLHLKELKKIELSMPKF
jgi:bla regulator protein BlaR1